MFTRESFEAQYLDLLEFLLTAGSPCADRTGVGTRVMHGGAIIQHDMSLGFPLMRHKRVPFKSMAAELKWFTEGSTSKKRLQELGSTIWDEWANQNAPELQGLTGDERKAKQRELDDMGEGTYGAQWRSFGELRPEDYGTSREGVDQLANIRKKLRENPTDRRMLCIAYNPNLVEAGECAIPPCHVLWKVDVVNGQLNLSFYMRSVDTFLGLPFNIASYALLMQLLCWGADLKPGILTGHLDNVHLYTNHLDQAKEAISRRAEALTKPLPKVTLVAAPHHTNDIISNWMPADLVLENYNPMPTIKGDVAV